MHALLSPSAAKRWINCTPSVRMESNFKDRSSVAADEGTLAHELSELLLREKLGRIETSFYKARLTEIKNHDLYDASMLTYCEEYAEYVLETYAVAKAADPNAEIFLEVKLDLTAYIPEGFGTSDVVIVTAHRIYIIDLKYGKGVAVYAENNEQVKVYALGAYDQLRLFNAITDVHATIYQPRIDNITETVITIGDLTQWADDVLKPAAVKAFEGGGQPMAGDHCKFCKAKPICVAYTALMETALTDAYPKGPEYISDAKVAEILLAEKEISAWLKSVKEHALYEATANGRKWPGFKLVEGRSNRIITDSAKAARLLFDGFPDLTEDDIYKPKTLVSMTELEKLVGKKPFAQTLGGIIAKPDGAPTLAPESDKRPELSKNKSQSIFEQAIADSDPMFN